MENLEHILKIYDIAWQNVRHNSTIRNRYFSLFLIISGTFFLILDKLTTGKISEEIPMLPVLASSFIYLISLMFVSMFTRVRRVILRDLAVIKNISDYLVEKDMKGLSGAIKTYNNFYSKKEQGKVYKFFAPSRILWITTALVSSLMMIIGLEVSFDLATSDLVCLFTLFIVIHIVYEMIANHMINN
jgi:hypothetical protein